MRTLLPCILLALLAMLVLTSLVSLMAVFMGGGQSGADLGTLKTIQLWSIPVTLLITLNVLLSYPKTRTRRARELWDDVPQWLVFIFMLLNSLSIAGVVALYIAMRAFETSVSWEQHIPLVCLFCASLAFCAIYARTFHRDGAAPPLAGRWGH